MRWRFERFSAGDRIPTEEVPHDCAELVIIGNQRMIMQALMLLLAGVTQHGLPTGGGEVGVSTAGKLHGRIEETDRWIRERRDG